MGESNPAAIEGALLRAIDTEHEKNGFVADRNPVRASLSDAWDESWDCCLGPLLRAGSWRR